uniref:Uncharacterized protein n=1 Tax=Setaria italica TaxID=4555 RepID=K4AM58_SETIT
MTLYWRALEERHAPRENYLLMCCYLHCCL